MSDDAGAYLCEELLYTLEEFKDLHPAIEQVLFVHVPPFGSALVYKGREQLCSDALLTDFGQSLLQALLD